MGAPWRKSLELGLSNLAKVSTKTAAAFALARCLSGRHISYRIISYRIYI